MKFSIFNFQFELFWSEIKLCLFSVKWKNLLLVLVLGLALFLRIYKISDYPAGLNADEAAIGYNAYSLLKTGKDEFGHSWPINFQSFNDYKPGLYFYLVLPFVKIFGLNELAVRLPNVILGTLTVLLLYFLVNEMFAPELTQISFRIDPNTLALVSSVLLAVSPWHIHFSRGGWESNASLFFMTLGVYLFFISLKKPKYFAFCILSFALSMFTYHSARVIVPLLGLGLVVFYRKKIFLRQNFRCLVLAAVVGGVLMTILLYSMQGAAGASRFSGVGIFADQGPIWRVNELRGQHTDPFSSFPKIIHSKYFGYGIQFLDNFLRHFNGDFLFISGDEIQRNKVPEMGQMYLIEIPFLVLGLYFLIKNKQGNWKFILWWLMVAPVASALTFQSPHAIRALNMVIPLVILTGYGVIQCFCWLKEKTSLYYVLCIMYLGLLIWNLSFYLHQYYVHYPKTYPAAWEYGFKGLVGYIKEVGGKYETIYVTNKYDQPYILFAFYLKYPPAQFQKEAKLTPRDQYGFSTVEHFGKYYFGPVDLTTLPAGGRTLVIGAPNEIPDSATILKRVYFKDGKTEAFRISEN